MMRRVAAAGPLGHGGRAGAYKMRDGDQDTDSWSVEAGWIRPTPITFNLTARDHLRMLEEWDLPMS